MPRASCADRTSAPAPPDASPRPHRHPPGTGAHRAARRQATEPPVDEPRGGRGVGTRGRPCPHLRTVGAMDASATEPPDRLNEIALLLNRRQWRPSPVELEAGAAFFHLLRRAEQRQRPEFPRGTRVWQQTYTEAVAAGAEGVWRTREDLLPVWRDRLAASPMRELLEMYAGRGQPLLDHAQRLAAAWRAACLPEPAADLVEAESRRLGIAADAGLMALRYARACRWEETQLPRALRDELDALFLRLETVRSTVMAAVTGDVDF